MMDQTTKNLLESKLEYLLRRSHKKLVEIEQDMFVRGGDYPKYALDEAKELYQYVKEIVSTIKKLNRK